MYDFILPDIGEGISEALLINWSVQPGQAVKEGDEIATVSTDKVDVELPSPRDGVVSELCWKPGDTVPVGQVFMRIDIGGAESEAKADTPKAEKKKAPVKVGKPAAKKAGGSVVAAPSTRKLAHERGIDLADVDGSGPGGRILRKDLDGGAKPASTPMPAGAVTREPLNGVRMAMAEKMAKSVHTLAHSTMNFEVDAAPMLALMDKLAPAAEKAGVKLSATALLIKCAAHALAASPRFNAVIDEDARELLLHADVDMSIAVATARGLIVPVVAQVNRKTLFAVSAELTALVAAGRDGTMKPAAGAQGTFTLSNTGGLEKARITSTRPVVNAPQTATLWVSRIREQPIVVDGALRVGPVMHASLSFDHRFIDGAEAVAFINDLAAAFEVPEQALAG